MVSVLSVSVRPKIVHRYPAKTLQQTLEAASDGKISSPQLGNRLNPPVDKSTNPYTPEWEWSYEVDQFQESCTRPMSSVQETRTPIYRIAHPVGRHHDGPARQPIHYSGRPGSFPASSIRRPIARARA